MLNVTGIVRIYFSRRLCRAHVQYKKDEFTHVLLACENNISKLVSFHSTCFQAPLFAERILSFNRAVNHQQMQLSCPMLIATCNSQLLRDAIRDIQHSVHPFLQVLTYAVNLLYEVNLNFRDHVTIKSYVTYSISPNIKPGSCTEITAQKSRSRLISQTL
jgi:hypothetical protein